LCSWCFLAVIWRKKQNSIYETYLRYSSLKLWNAWEDGNKLSVELFFLLSYFGKIRRTPNRWALDTPRWGSEVCVCKKTFTPIKSKTKFQMVLRNYLTFIRLGVLSLRCCHRILRSAELQTNKQTSIKLINIIIQHFYLNSQSSKSATLMKP